MTYYGKAIFRLSSFVCGAVVALAVVLLAVYGAVRLCERFGVLS